jgi:tetratricopeptide (TPR) repeat protein
MGHMLILFLVISIIILFIQPLFPPIVTIILGFGVVWYARTRFMKTATKIFGDILDSGKANNGASYKSYGKTMGQNPEGDKYKQAYIYNEIKEADELNLKRCLDKALEKYADVLKRLSVEDKPNEYAHVNFNIGVAYEKLSEERENEDNTFKAIAAFEECLKVYSIDRHPIDFALTQCELGQSYGKLSGTGDEEHYALIAAFAYERALKVYTAYEFPLHYAAIHNNIGNLYGNLITSMEQKEYYSKAFSAYNEALKFITEDINPEVYKLVKDNFALTNLKCVTPTSDIDYYNFTIVKDLDKIIRTDYRKNEYLRKLVPVVKKNFYHLNDEELHKLCNTLADMSKDLEDYFYSSQEVVEALYSYMEFARLNIGNVFGDKDKAMEYFRTIYKWATPEVESYRERLKPIIDKQYSYLKPYEKAQLCKTICEVAKFRDNFGHSPEEMVSDINSYVAFARIDIRDVIGDVSSTLHYFRDILR